MSPHAFGAYFSKFEARSYKKRWPLISPDHPVHKIYYIKSGYVRLFSVSRDGEEITLIIYKPGDFFPLIAALQQNVPFRYHVETLTQASIISVPVGSFITFYEGQPHLLMELLIRTMARLDRIIRRLEYAVFGDAYQKVVSALLVLEEAFRAESGQETIINAPLTHREIASIVGLTRETTSGILSELRKKGHIDYKGKHILVKNRKGLLEESLLEAQ